MSQENLNKFNNLLSPSYDRGPDSLKEQEQNDRLSILSEIGSSREQQSSYVLEGVNEDSLDTGGQPVLIKDSKGADEPPATLKHQSTIGEARVQGVTSIPPSENRASGKVLEGILSDLPQDANGSFFDKPSERVKALQTTSNSDKELSRSTEEVSGTDTRNTSQQNIDEDRGSREGAVPRTVDFLIMGVHGIGTNPYQLAQYRKHLKEHLKFVKKFWFWEINFKFHVELIDWKSELLPRQINAFKRILPDYDSHISNATPADAEKVHQQLSQLADPPLAEKMKSAPTSTTRTIDARQVFTDHISDLLCFMTPAHGDFIVQSVARQLNQVVNTLRSRPHWRFAKSKVILIGHSLGGIILYELLTKNKLRPTSTTFSNLPALDFDVDSLFLWGTPLAAFSVLNNDSFALQAPSLPKGVRVFNIFHPSDPIAFRLEPLFYPRIDSLPPAVRLPYWRTNGSKEYRHWEKDAVRARRAFKLYLENLKEAAGQKFRDIFTTQEEGTGDGKSSSNSTSPALQMIDKKMAENKKKERFPALQIWSSPRQVYRQKLNAENRYGLHYKQASSRIGILSRTPSTKGVSVKKNQQLWQGGKRKAATLNQLMSALDLPETSFMDLRNILHTGTEREIQVSDIDLSSVQNVTGQPPFDDAEILSEVEEAGGLELPVRLDFSLQEELTERYLTHLGTIQSHFNYWVSRDAAFFLLKTITNFRPKIAHNDFLKAVEYTEKRKKIAISISKDKTVDETTTTIDNKSVHLDSTMSSTSGRLEELDRLRLKKHRTISVEVPDLDKPSFANGAEVGKHFLNR